MMHQVDGDRLWDSLLDMGEVGRFDGVLNRLAFGDGDKAARDLFVSWLRDAGLEIRVDGIGNIFGVLRGSGSDLLPIVAGSHLDTVSDAGVFDGALGVLAGLEVAKRLTELDVERSRDFVVAAFSNEEGSRFQPDMMGSMVYTGELPLGEAWKATDDDGLAVRDELQRIGYLGEGSVEAGCYLELHVEQGPVLHQNGLEVGVVQGIQGMAWWDGRYFGEANHAGTTPLPLRRDALLGAAELCMYLRETAFQHGQDSVATMGRLHPYPDIRNVVPGEAFFTVDFRQYEPILYEEGKELVENLIKIIAEKHRLEYTLKQTVDAKPVRFNPDMVNMVREKTEQLGYSYLDMHSGAGHDAQFMCKVCPTAMIFVPSQKGVSHSPNEKTNKKDCINGANVLLNCVLELLEK